MYPRTEYEMTEADLARLLKAMQPTPVMFLSGGTPIGGDQQTNANAAWSELGSRMGFDSMTVRPIAGKGMRFFTAVPSETPEAKAARHQREREKGRQKEIDRLNGEIAERRRRVAELELAAELTTADETAPGQAPTALRGGQP